MPETITLDRKKFDRIMNCLRSGDSPIDRWIVRRNLESAILPDPPDALELVVQRMNDALSRDHITEISVSWFFWCGWRVQAINAGYTCGEDGRWVKEGEEDDG